MDAYVFSGSRIADAKFRNSLLAPQKFPAWLTKIPCCASREFVTNILIVIVFGILLTAENSEFPAKFPDSRECLRCETFVWPRDKARAQRGCQKSPAPAWWRRSRPI